MSTDEGSNQSQADELAILNKVISDLTPLQPDSQKKILQSVITFLGINVYDKPVDTTAGGVTESSQAIEKRVSSFSDNRVMSAKEFLLEKEPKSDVERVACLAYYLTHYKNTPHFKTIDISLLNTEAAQRKLSNATVSVDNATKQGYLVPAIKGLKQLSASGEKFVQVLPDRSAAREIMKRSRPHRKPKEGKTEITNKGHSK